MFRHAHDANEKRPARPFEFTSAMSKCAVNGAIEWAWMVSVNGRPWLDEVNFIPLLNKQS